MLLYKGFFKNLDLIFNNIILRISGDSVDFVRWDFNQLKKSKPKEIK